MSAGANRKLAANRIHSSSPANTVYSPPKGFLRNNRSNLTAGQAKISFFFFFGSFSFLFVFSFFFQYVSISILFVYCPLPYFELLHPFDSANNVLRPVECHPPCFPLPIHISGRGWRNKRGMHQFLTHCASSHRKNYTTCLGPVPASCLVRTKRTETHTALSFCFPPFQYAYAMVS